MRVIPTALLVTAFALTAGDASAQVRAELAESKVIWDRAPHTTSTDLARFKDRWFVVCTDATEADSNETPLRVLSSADGEKWEAVAQITSPTPKRGLGSPRFSTAPDGRLMVTATGIVPTPNVPDPLPRFGGTIKTMAWFSADGHKWGDHEPIGLEDYSFGRVAWNKGVAYCSGHGVICGSMQTVKFFAGKGDEPLANVSEKTFSAFFPGAAAVAFDGDTAHCVMTRYSTEVGNRLQTGYFGTAKAPYKEWAWKEMDARITAPNLIRLPDGGFVAVVGLYDKKARTVLCGFDPATGKLDELLELPTGGSVADVGLAVHDKHVWVSYHARHEGKVRVHLAKVKVTRP